MHIITSSEDKTVSPITILIVPPSGHPTGSPITITTELSRSEANIYSIDETYFETINNPTQNTSSCQHYDQSDEPTHLTSTKPFRAPSDSPRGAQTQIPSKTKISDHIFNPVSDPYALE